ncbi:hypothetical protein ACFVVM_17375 [Nocardia sp. NPDC058176]|uniref:hypothetical protein n=1 Tax=Nocardia sp. NPDC058176 TaxID=3346368 RepID=UPI0036DDDDC6
MHIVIGLVAIIGICDIGAGVTMLVNGGDEVFIPGYASIGIGVITLGFAAHLWRTER